MSIQEKKKIQVNYLQQNFKTVSKSSLPHVSNDLYFFFHFHTCRSSQWRKLLHDLLSLIKNEKIQLFLVSYHTGVFNQKHKSSVSLLVHERTKMNHLDSLLQGSSFIVSIKKDDQFFEKDSFSRYSKILKRITKENQYVFLGGFFQNEFYHSHEMWALFSCSSPLHIFVHLLYTLSSSPRTFSDILTWKQKENHHPK